MQEHGYCRRCEIPAFGNWDCYDGLPFTQCFDKASRQQQPPAVAAGHLRYGYSHDRDLYVAGDLYANNAVTPAMILVPRRGHWTPDQANEEDDDVCVKGSEAKGKKDGKWVGDLEETLSPLPAAAALVTRPTPKPVDEDLYKIPPELLHVKPRKKRGLSFFSCWLLPTCAM